MSSAEFVGVAHDHGIPVIVDAVHEPAASVEPAALRRRGRRPGRVSGGKAIRGPQGAGFLAGRSDLLLSVALQHQDMDVLPETWRRREILC